MCERACVCVRDGEGELARELAALLLVVEMRRTEAVAYSVQYSVEREATLWDGGDRVEEAARTFYVALRHFSGELIGRHVGLSGAVVRWARGETRTYRLKGGVGERAGEHLSLYVYNPGVNRNGALSFGVCGRNECALEGVCVAADTCPAVARWECAQMRGELVTELVNRADGYVIRVRIIFPASSSSRHTSASCFTF